MLNICCYPRLHSFLSEPQHRILFTRRPAVLYLASAAVPRSWQITCNRQPTLTECMNTHTAVLTYHRCANIPWLRASGSGTGSPRIRDERQRRLPASFHNGSVSAVRVWTYFSHDRPPALTHSVRSSLARAERESRAPEREREIWHSPARDKNTAAGQNIPCAPRVHVRTKRASVQQLPSDVNAFRLAPVAAAAAAAVASLWYAHPKRGN